jgi:hypothetical protein
VTSRSRARVEPYFSAQHRQLASVVVSLPMNPSVNWMHMDDDEYDRWRDRHCNKQKLRLFARRVQEKFELRKPRVRTSTLRGRYYCHVWVHELPGTERDRALFREVRAWVEKNAPATNSVRSWR